MTDAQNQTSDINKAWPDNQPDADNRQSETRSKDERNLHPTVIDDDTLKASGRQVNAVNESIKSVHPSTNSKSDEDFKMIDNAIVTPDLDEDSFKYPFFDMEIGQGIFIPVETNSTIDKLMKDLHQQIEMFRRQTADIEKDENGDNISEIIIIHEKKRNPDGTIQLNDANKPNEGANQTIRPKYIYAYNFTVRSVIKDDELVEDGQKAESDGALLVRVL